MKRRRKQREERNPTKHKNKYYRLVDFYYFKCFRLVLKSKGYASLFADFCLAYGWAEGWRAVGPSLAKRKYITELFLLLFQMLSLSKQRKCQPFLKLCLEDQTKQTKIYHRIVYFDYFKCFRLVLTSQGNACLFSNFVWRTDGRGAGGRRGQTCQTEIYYRIVYFYCFKWFRLVLKSKGNARRLSNFVWQRKCSQFLKLCLADDND